MDPVIEFIDINKNVSSTLPMTLPMDLPISLPTALLMVLPMALPMALLTDLLIASSLMTNEINKVCSPLSSSLVTDETNIDLPLPLLSYPNISLQIHFHCITRIDFPYHPLLYHNHSASIETIIPIIKILISSFRLNYALIFSHCDTNNPCPFAVLFPFVQSVIPSWYISTHIVLSHSLCDNVSCSCSFLYLSPPQLHLHSFFTRQYPPLYFPNSLHWLSSTFNTSQFRLFTVKILLMLPPHLPHQPCSITLDLKGLYSEILTIFPSSRPLSSIPFIQH